MWRGRKLYELEHLVPIEETDITGMHLCHKGMKWSVLSSNSVLHHLHLTVLHHLEDMPLTRRSSVLKNVCFDLESKQMKTPSRSTHTHKKKKKKKWKSDLAHHLKYWINNWMLFGEKAKKKIDKGPCGLFYKTESYSGSQRLCNCVTYSLPFPT